MPWARGNGDAKEGGLGWIGWRGGGLERMDCDEFGVCRGDRMRQPTGMAPHVQTEDGHRLSECDRARDGALRPCSRCIELQKKEHPITANNVSTVSKPHLP